MVKKQVLNAAQEYAKAVREIMKPSAVLLYGSQVRGTATPDSDIDIAVIVREPPEDYLSAMAALWKLTRKIDDAIEPVLLTLEDEKGGFLSTVQHTGMPL